jgi:hypothetical protein
MQESEAEIVRLLYKRITNDKLEPEEEELLNKWVDVSPYNRRVCEEVTDNLLLEKEIRHLAAQDRRTLWKQIMEKI